MRDFFIRALDRIVGLVVILGAVAVLGGAAATLVSAEGGLFPALLILVGGSFYLLVAGGLLYLFLGIHENTRRTAEALERR
ncbi:hypothetical protein [Jannaschia ovalis]|uniref:Holin-X, holin superfamily III n=1 Tax=Jannaschia ovalis TaxID=3038773 RepID=A0ABY8LH56_9RHOB|nr:hypothetical protein [Jannaschia sp. GRR-S6-38]WGH79514.1 hypothetical protein P8627_04410 [Jannaschia sp. GRR-S6-38]